MTITAPRPVLARQPKAPARIGRSQRVVELVSSAAAALALTWVVVQVSALGHGLGALLVWYLFFLVTYRYVVRRLHGRAAANDRVTTVVVWTTALIAAVPVFLIVGEVIAKGAAHVRTQFFTQTSVKAVPSAPATVGGALQAVIGTLEQVALAVAIAVPLGILVAVYLNEVGGALSRAVRAVVEAMSGLPAVIAGVFIYTLVVSGWRWGDSGFAGALALAVTMLPIVCRTSEEMLRLVPGGVREASMALGAPQWRSVRTVVIPAARTGLITAAILGVARAAGETAPLILTAGSRQSLNANPFHGLQDSLPMYIYTRIESPSPTQVQRAWIAAFVLIALVLVLFTLARALGGRTPEAHQ
jgi:phosphate transport system permease protein